MFDCLLDLDLCYKTFLKLNSTENEIDLAHKR